MNRNHQPPPLSSPVPARFGVGGHVVKLSKVSEGRWTAAVDDRPVDGSYPTEADAWQAGVREADRLDRR